MFAKRQVQNSHMAEQGLLLDLEQNLWKKTRSVLAEILVCELQAQRVTITLGSVMLGSVTLG